MDNNFPSPHLTIRVSKNLSLPLMGRLDSTVAGSPDDDTCRKLAAKTSANSDGMISLVFLPRKCSGGTYRTLGSLAHQSRYVPSSSSRNMRSGKADRMALFLA